MRTKESVMSLKVGDRIILLDVEKIYNDGYQTVLDEQATVVKVDEDLGQIEVHCDDLPHCYFLARTTQPTYTFIRL